MKWVSAISQRENLWDALGECFEQLADFGESIDLALVFTSGHRQELDELPQRLRASLKPRSVIGCSGGGVIAAGRESEGRKAISLTLAHLPDVELHGFHLETESLPDPDAAPEVWREAIGLPASETIPHFLLLPEPFSFDTEALLRGLDYAYPHSQKLGAVAANARRPSGNRLLLDRQVYSRGMVGLALSGLQVDCLLAQGCRPIGEAYTVTKGERNLIFQMNGKTAMDCLTETRRKLPKKDQKQAEKSLLLGFQGQAGLSLASLLETRPAAQPQFLIRNLVAADLKRGTLASSGKVRPGQIVQFHVRDAESAREELRKVLRAYNPPSKPAAALLFSSVGRGSKLYGEADYDSHQLLKEFPGLNASGFFGGGEIGPLGDTTYVHGYTACYAIFRPL